MSDLRKLIGQRKIIRAKVTACYNRRDSYESLSASSKAVDIAQLKDYQAELPQLNLAIQDLKSWDSDDAFDEELISCEEYKGKIRDSLTILNYHNSLILHRPSQSSRNDIDHARSLLRQPVAPLPTFSGAESEDLIRFIREFELTTSSYNYPDRDLLLLLRQQVSDRAKTLLNSLEADKQSYNDAKQLLTAAFASPEARKFSSIKKISEINLNYGDDPFAFISKVKMLMESVIALNISANDFFGYFVWHGMNEGFRNQLIQITTKTRPSIQEIIDNFFVANERYEHFQKLKKKKYTDSPPKERIREKSTTSFAVKAKDLPVGGIKNCSLCTKVNNETADHPIYKCKKFITPRDKVEKIKSYEGCIKCASLIHKTQDCKFSFRRKCDNCSLWHFSFLCMKAKLNDKVDSETNSGVVVMQNSCCNSILPTFSFRMKDYNELMRGLKDTGSQSSFISEKIANLHQLRIVQNNISLTVSGFNAPQHYRSKLVEVPIILRGKLHIVLALVVKEIKVNIELPKLGLVVKKFKEKGYDLADLYLNSESKSIDNIDLLIGADLSHLIPGRDVCFGEQNSSVYIDSPLGILLFGDIDRLLQDLDNLSYQTSSDSHSYSSDINYRTLQNVSTSELFHSNVLFCSNFRTSFASEEIQQLQFEALDTSVKLSVLNEKGKIVESELQRATEEVLESECFKYINYDTQIYNEDSMELHDKLINYSLNNIKRDEIGRIIVPLLWNGQNSHLLSKNQNLAKLVMMSNLKKLKRNENNLKLVDQTFKDQLKAGIIEKVENLEEFLNEYPGYSFLPHMSIFKPDRETTKCRVVFLSNLNEKDRSKPLTVSHNQAMFSGPSLNQKLSSALIHLRFDKYLLTYDLCKAFNQLLLSPSDQSKLLFFWFNNIEKNDFSLVTYKNVRLSFGLRCSPFLLLIALYYILVILSESDSPKIKGLKQLMYSLIYMDNGAVSFENKEEIQWAYEQLQPIFDPFKFSIQQLSTNNLDLQKEIDEVFNEKTPDNVKLFGLMWNRNEDTISTKPIDLNALANTKRSILKTIAGQFDLYNINMPLLNRARLFMHGLQCNKDLSWDAILSPDLQKEWKNICKQANSVPDMPIQRYVGPRTGTYKLIAFTDASHVLYGLVVYILHVETGKLSFLLAKNRMVNSQLKLKSIPSLEFNAITLGVENLIELYGDLSGPKCIHPINIIDLILYSDSLCSLHWLNASSNKFEKMQKRSIFIMNRLQTIHRLCETSPVTFYFISGKNNPADCVTRCISYKRLIETNYVSGPNVTELNPETEYSVDNLISVTIPNPIASSTNQDDEESSYIQEVEPMSLSVSTSHPDPLLDPKHFSSFHRLVLVFRRVLICFKKWKLKAGIGLKDGMKEENNFALASRLSIRYDQMKYFPEVFNYFKNPKISKYLPPIVSQLNIFLDDQDILRVKSKFKKWRYSQTETFPILLFRNSKLTEAIVMDFHFNLAHSGCYSVLSELRKSFYIPHHFSTIKKILKNCCHCRRFNSRTLKLNQSSYREFRTDPPSIPFANIFIDHLGPIQVKKNNQTVKIWLLCITCTWSRAINLKICHDLTLKEFLRAFQIHCYEFGVPQLCVSDLGSQLLAGSNLITDFLNDPDTQSYFEQNNIKPLKFQQYFKGHSELGSLVETCVKMVKRLLFGSIKNNILSYYDFEFLIYYVIHLANRRPIAFKEYLRDSASEIPEPITPEHLIRGYELTSINLIPELHNLPQDPNWQPGAIPTDIVKNSFIKLGEIRTKLIEIYQNEFIAKLVSQAVDRKDRFKPVTHESISIGDIVLLKETHTKPNQYPMGIVKEIVTNDLGEVTGAIIMKGKTRELLKRHSSTIIPLLETNVENPGLRDSSHSTSTEEETSIQNSRLKYPRKAANLSRKKTKRILEEENL